MNPAFYITVLVLVYIRDSNQQCSCAGDGSRFVNGEEIPNTLCSAETLIEAVILDVADGPDDSLEYKIDIKDVLRGNINGVAHREFLYTPLPDPMCTPNIILAVGERYILSVGKTGSYWFLDTCQFGSETRYVTKIQRDLMKYGCP